jgi:LytS/YehU family sensor histidine kinase
LMLCTNLGLKYYYLMLDNRQKLFNLEKENLNQQLTYLRYQINPHFFMNTLNNIHALVDIDPEKAKESIVELSKLMRYILYEGSKPTIPLDLETEFLETVYRLDEDEIQRQRED